MRNERKNMAYGKLHAGARYRHVRIFAAMLICAIAGLSAAGCSQEVETPKLNTVNLRIGEHVAVVEVAVTEEQLRTGLMHRRELLPNHGMIFIFPSERHLDFWMKNTHVPLSIAFIDSRGRILQIEDMEPLSEELTSSRQRALFALEMERGWFRERGIEPGAVVEFPPELSSIIRYYRRAR